MGLTKFLLALFLIGLTLPHVSLAAKASQLGHQRFLDGHNAERAAVGVAPLTWNNSLAAYARNYANTRIEKCEMEHSNGPYGECIAEGYGNFKASDVVRMWAGEKKYYDHASNTCAAGESCGHYTQVVWRDTKYLGCARVKCKNGWMFVICSYDPPGNYEGESPY
ncbi:hypothetical protein FH972_004743 [Carpinus fangiana]|uniref:SCP domain-containing protein n=1 Tax=Carpinus fangiana TaxID=176857 RepID=A0A5N6QMS0_9ROSI|nr:hypothetical protein FH972_004743 [Carpinus fangiana]